MKGALASVNSSNEMWPNIATMFLLANITIFKGVLI